MTPNSYHWTAHLSTMLNQANAVHAYLAFYAHSLGPRPLLIMFSTAKKWFSGLIVSPHSSFVFSTPLKNDRSRFHCIWIEHHMSNYTKNNFLPKLYHTPFIQVRIYHHVRGDPCTYCTDLLHWSTRFNFSFVPRGKISNPDRNFNAEFKYASSFSPSPTVFLWQPS
jgi:hypothetical protein